MYVEWARLKASSGDSVDLGCSSLGIGGGEDIVSASRTGSKVMVKGDKEWAILHRAPNSGAEFWTKTHSLLLIALLHLAQTHVARVAVTCWSDTDKHDRYSWDALFQCESVH